MTVRVRTQVLVVVSEGVNEQNCEYKRDQKAQIENISTEDTEQSGGSLELAASESDFALPKGKVVTIQQLYIESDSEVLIKLDGEGTGHRLKPSGGRKGKLALFDTQMTDAPLITNVSTTAVANISYMMAGKKT